MFTDDALTASYYTTQLSSEVMPEKKLMIAVLTDAIGVLARPVPDGDNKDNLQREQDQAREWILLKSDCGIFSFVGICGCLDFDAEYLREGIRRLIRV